MDNGHTKYGAIVFDKEFRFYPMCHSSSRAWGPIPCFFYLEMSLLPSAVMLLTKAWDKQGQRYVLPARRSTLPDPPNALGTWHSRTFYPNSQLQRPTQVHFQQVYHTDQCLTQITKTAQCSKSCCFQGVWSELPHKSWMFKIMHSMFLDIWTK